MATDVNPTAQRRGVTSDQALVLMVCLFALFGLAAVLVMGG